MYAALVGFVIKWTGMYICALTELKIAILFNWKHCVGYNVAHTCTCATTVSSFWTTGAM